MTAQIIPFPAQSHMTLSTVSITSIGPGYLVEALTDAADSALYDFFGHEAVMLPGDADQGFRTSYMVDDEAIQLLYAELTGPTLDASPHLQAMSDDSAELVVFPI